MRIVFEKRQSVSRRIRVLVPVVSMVFALIFGAFLFLFSGVNPLVAYAAMARGAFGDIHAVAETMVKAIPLMLTGLGVSIAFRMLFWNIGAEGQLAMGGLVATGVALYASEVLPPWSVLPAVILLGMVAGALWAAVPAALRAYLQVNETITTLMMNYIAILLVSHVYHGPWRDPDGYGFPGTARFPEVAWLPRLYDRAHMGLVFAIIAAAILWFLVQRTKWGFELRITGENPKAARYIGIRIPRLILVTMLVSGALCGLAGACEVTGVMRRLQQGLTVDYGYTAIIVAWMGQLNPWGVLLVAFLLAGLLVGGDQIQMAMGLPAAMGLVMQGALLFPMLGGALFAEYRLRIVRGSAEEAVLPQESLAEESKC
ncbi:MAG: ABC transporter permease [Anaerolineae bacterium]